MREPEKYFLGYRQIHETVKDLAGRIDEVERKPVGKLPLGCRRYCSPRGSGQGDGMTVVEKKI
jgi:hypothetical protein